MSPHVIVVDAYDSFVHIIVNYFQRLGCDVSLYRKDDVRLLEAIRESAGDALLLGPGPGHPSDSGYEEMLNLNAGQMPVLGICLGHQAIGLHYGCHVEYADRLMHGKTSKVIHDGMGCFSRLPKEFFSAMRYHSLVISNQYVPNEIEVSAKSVDDGYVMGIRHKTQKIEGIQFHPESIGTDFGLMLLRNFIEEYVVLG